MTHEWIDCNYKLPTNNEEVHIIFYIRDYNDIWDANHNFQRMFGTGKFSSRNGWWVRNGYVLNKIPNGNNDRFLSWGGVIYWKPMNENEKKLFLERTLTGDKI